MSPKSLLEQSVISILALLELINCYQENGDSTDFRPSDLTKKSRINQCYFKILQTRRRVLTRCLPCGFSDEASSSKTDCFHHPYKHKLSINGSRIPADFMLIESLTKRNPLYTPIIATDCQTFRSLCLLLSSN